MKSATCASDLVPDRRLVSADERRVHLLNAGNLVLELVNARRASWTLAAREDSGLLPSAGQAAPAEDRPIHLAAASDLFPSAGVAALPGPADRIRSALAAGVRAVGHISNAVVRFGKLTWPALVIVWRALVRLGRLSWPILVAVLRAARAVIARVPAPVVLRWALRTILVASCLAAVAAAGSKGVALWSTWKSAPTLGTAILESNPPGSLVAVDGTVLGSTPMTTTLTTGRHLVEFKRGNQRRTLEIDVARARPAIARLVWTRAGASRPRVPPNPPGTRNSARQPATLALGQSAGVEGSTAMDWGAVQSALPVDASDRNGGLPLDAERKVRAAAGPLDRRPENGALGLGELRHVDVKSGERAATAAEPPLSALTVTATEPAEVRIDGERVGETPLDAYPVKDGTHEIAVISSSGAERRFTVTVASDTASLDVDFSTR